MEVENVKNTISSAFKTYQDGVTKLTTELEGRLALVRAQLSEVEAKMAHLSDCRELEKRLQEAEEALDKFHIEKDIWGNYIQYQPVELTKDAEGGKKYPTYIKFCMKNGRLYIES